MKESLVLRDDLGIIRKRENGGHYYQVTDPRNGETYEFGEQEWYLLNCMDGESGPEDVIEKFSQEYLIELTQDQFSSFVSMVSDWGLFAAEGDTARVPDYDLSSTINDNEFASTSNDVIDITPSDITEVIAEERPFQSRSRSTFGAASEDVEVSWVLFNPNGLLYGLNRLLSPLRWLRYILPVFIIIACAIIFNNFQVFIYDFLRFRTPLSIIQILIFSMFTVNLVTQLSKGMVARSFGVDVKKFGIMLAIGIVPRFAVELGNIESLTRSQKIAVHSSTLWCRSVIFSISALIWIMSRTSGTMLPTICLMLLTVAIFSFFIAANPLYNSEGYRLLTTLLEIPGLKQKANLALFGKKDNPLTNRLLQEDNLFALRAYALSSFIFVIVLFGAVLILSARWFEMNYQGTGVVIYLTLTIYLFWRFYSRFVKKRTEMKERRSRFEAAMTARNYQSGVASGPDDTGKGKYDNAGGSDNKKSRLRRLWSGKMIRNILLIVFLGVLFVPYPYETGGVLVVLPNKQHEIYAETPGVIKNVLHKDGVFLKAGTVVAHLSSYEQEKNLITTQASILEQEAKLDQLRNTPTKEDINLAKSRLETARTQYKYTSESAKRLEALYKDGNVSLDDYHDEQKQMMVDRAQVSEAQANLEKVIAGPHPKEIEAAEFELHRLKERLKFDQDEMTRTNLVMPMDGKIVTENLDHMIGLYLDEGDPFATVENDEFVRIQIKVPESDIADVKLGSDARFKVWAYGDTLFYGQVSEIAPAALEETYGKVITVTVVIDNENQQLKSGMTGFGKVDGGTKLVVVAFTRMLVRFFTIEIWSWIP